MREGRVVRHNARRQNFSFTVAVFARSNKETRNRNIGFFFSLLLTWIREFLFENTAERGRMIIVQRRDYLLQHLYSPRKRDVINLAMRRTISLVEKTAANAYLSLLRSLWYQTGRKSVARIFTSISRNFSRSEFRCATGVLKENYDLTDTARDYARPMSFYLRVKTSRRKLFESTKMKNFKSRPFVCLKTRRWKIVETSNTDETVFPLRTWFTPKNSRSWKFCDTRPWKPRVSYVAIVFIFVNTSVKIVTLKYEKLNN